MPPACIWRKWVTVGSKITVVTRLGGNMILQVRDSRVALDESMARRIMY